MMSDVITPPTIGTAIRLNKRRVFQGYHHMIAGRAARFRTT